MARIFPSPGVAADAATVTVALVAVQVSVAFAGEGLPIAMSRPLRTGRTGRPVAVVGSGSKIR
jgi:hypothetical protein